MHYTERELEELKTWDPAQYRLLVSLKEMEDEDGKKETKEPEEKHAKEETNEEGDEVVEEEAIDEDKVDEVKEVDEEESEEVKDVEYWRKLGEQAKAANDQSRADEAKDAIAPEDKSAGLLEKLASLEEKVSALNVKPDVEESDAQLEADDDEDYLRENFPELLKRVQKAEKLAAERARREAEAMIADRLKPLEDLRKQSEAQLEEEKRRAFAARHFAEVKAAHQDVEDFFDDSKLGLAYKAWANAQPPILKRAALAPLDCDAADAAYAIEQFKRSVGINKQKKMLGSADMASKSLVARGQAKSDQGPKVLSEYELRNFSKLTSNAAREGEKALETLMKRYELTLKQMEK